MDRYGLEMFLPAEQRDPTVLALLERGYAERMFLSAGLLRDDRLVPGRGRRAAARVGRWPRTGPCRKVPEQVIPALREGGMTDEQLETMMVANPRRWLAG